MLGLGVPALDGLPEALARIGSLGGLTGVIVQASVLVFGSISFAISNIIFCWSARILGLVGGFALPAMLLSAVGVYLPARRATRVSPCAALRAD